jgi:hypothetical protein
MKRTLAIAVALAATLGTIGLASAQTYYGSYYYPSYPAPTTVYPPAAAYPYGYYGAYGYNGTHTGGGAAFA